MESGLALANGPIMQLSSAIGLRRIESDLCCWSLCRTPPAGALITNSPSTLRGITLCIHTLKCIQPISPRFIYVSLPLSTFLPSHSPNVLSAYSPFAPIPYPHSYSNTHYSTTITHSREHESSLTALLDPGGSAELWRQISPLSPFVSVVVVVPSSANVPVPRPRSSAVLFPSPIFAQKWRRRWSTPGSPAMARGHFAHFEADDGQLQETLNGFNR